MIIQEILTQIKTELTNKNTTKAKEIYKKNIVEIEKYLQNQEYKRTTGQNYSGYNQLFISLSYEPWIFGTYKQLKALWYSTKNLKWVALLRPTFFKDKKTEKSTDKTEKSTNKDEKSKEILWWFAKYYVFPMINKIEI